MKNIFTTEALHTVTEANINYYAVPFVHPKRKMQQHDFIYLIDGDWKIGQNDKIYELKKDSLLILAAGNTHFGVTHCRANTKTMYFHVSCEKGDYSSDKAHAYAQNVLNANTLTDVSHNKTVKQLFSKIVDCKLSNKQRKADLYFQLLLCELSETASLTSDSGTALQIKNIIYNNPEKFFSNTELAQRMNVSVKTAENKFKAEFGTTIHQFILDFKIKEAISYFEIFPEMSIKEIAYNLGFYDEYHFSKQFKKITGLSPLAYKTKKK